MIRKGDPTAGTVVVKLATLNGRAEVWQRSFDLMKGERRWVVMSEGPESEIDEMLTRQRARDPDLWIIEVEDARGRSLLDQSGLAE